MSDRTTFSEELAKEIAGKLLSAYTSLLGILLGVVGIISPSAERVAGSIYTGASLFILMLCFVILLTAGSAFLCILTIAGLVRNGWIHIVLFGLILMAICGIIITWMIRIAL